MNSTLDNATISPGQVIGVSSAPPNGGTLTLNGTITNEGTIELNGTYSDNNGQTQDAGADLIIGPANSTVTLTGGGTILMDDVAGNVIQSPSGGGYGPNPPATLDNVNNVIEGSGTFAGASGANFQITNESNGTIDATGEANQLVIENLIVNDGLIEDTGGAGLNVQGNIDQTGGTIEANGAGTIVILVNTTISGGALSAIGGGTIQVDPGPQQQGNNNAVTLNGSASTVTLTSGSALDVDAAMPLNFIGTIKSNGTITVGGTSGSATLDVTGATKLKGTGDIVLSDGSNITGSGTLDNASTIEGNGLLQNAGITNESGGTIEGANGQLVIQTTVTNDGLLAATAGASLAVDAAIDQAGGGTLAANGAGSTVYLSNYSVSGGTLSTTGGGTFQVDPGYSQSFTLDGSASTVTLTSGSALDVDASTALDTTGTINNEGTITVGGTSGSATLDMTGATTLTGGGDIVLSDSSTLNGSGTLDNASTIEGNGFLQNAGITNESGGTIEGANGQLVVQTTVTNDGLLAATAGASLNVQANIDQAGGGTLAANGAGSAVYLVNYGVSGGTLSTSGGGTIQADAGNNNIVTLDGSASSITVTSGSAVNVDAGTFLYAVGTFDNQGTITLAGTSQSSANLEIDGATTLTGGGTVALDNGNLNPYGAASLDNVGDTIEGYGILNNNGYGPAFTVTNGAGGTIEANGGELNIQNAVTNDGLMEASSSGSTLVIGANIDQSGGGTLAANGAGSEVYLPGYTVTGGTVSTDGGSIAVGGNVTFNGALTVASTTDLVVRSGAGLLVTQSAALGGSIDDEGSMTLDGSTLTSQSIDALTGAGTVTAEDAANPATPQAMTLTIGADGSSSTFSGQINNQSSASLALVKVGSGTFTLAGSDNYAGGTTIEGGTLVLASGGAASGIISFAGSAASQAGATLEFAETSASTFAGTIENGANASSNTSVVIAGSAPVTLTGVNTYTGRTSVSGTLALAGTGSIQSSSKVALTKAGATFDISGASAGEVVNKLGGISGTLADLGGQTLKIKVQSGTIDTFSGLIQDGGLSGGSGGNLILGGTGELNLAGANTYTGATTLDAGTLALTGSGSIATSSSLSLQSSLGAAATFDMSGETAASIGTLSGVAGTLIDLGAGTLSVNEGVAGTFAGVIQDGGSAGGTGGSLVVGGAAALTLTGAEAYTGRTSVSGSLDIAGSGSIHSSTKVALTKVGATLDISGATTAEVINKLGGIAGTVADLGSQNLKIKVQSGTVDSFAGTIQDGGVAGGTGGSVTLGGLGELSLTAADSYTGGTTIDAGTLDLAAQGAAGTGTITFANPAANGVATLEIDAAALTSVTASVASATPTVTSAGQQYTFGNKIAGATSTNQVIDLTSLAYVPGSTSASVVGGTSLVVNDGSSTVTLTLASSTSKSAFVTANDGNGGTLVYDPPATTPRAPATAKIDTSWIETAMADFGGVSGDAHAQAALHDPYGPVAAASFEQHQGHLDKAVRGA